jgi:hypothetical protein
VSRDESSDGGKRGVDNLCVSEPVHVGHRRYRNGAGSSRSDGDSQSTEWVWGDHVVRRLSDRRWASWRGGDRWRDGRQRSSASWR